MSASDDSFPVTSARLAENVKLGLYVLCALVILALGGLRMHGEDSTYVLFGAAAAALLGWRFVVWLRRKRGGEPAPRDPARPGAGRRRPPSAG